MRARSRIRRSFAERTPGRLFAPRLSAPRLWTAFAVFGAATVWSVATTASAGAESGGEDPWIVVVDRPVTELVAEHGWVDDDAPSASSVVAVCAALTAVDPSTSWAPARTEVRYLERAPATGPQRPPLTPPPPACELDGDHVFEFANGPEDRLVARAVGARRAAVGAVDLSPGTYLVALQAWDDHLDNWRRSDRHWLPIALPPQAAEGFRLVGLDSRGEVFRSPRTDDLAEAEVEIFQGRIDQAQRGASEKRADDASSVGPAATGQGRSLVTSTAAVLPTSTPNPTGPSAPGPTSTSEEAGSPREESSERSEGGFGGSGGQGRDEAPIPIGRVLGRAVVLANSIGREDADPASSPEQVGESVEPVPTIVELTGAPLAFPHEVAVVRGGALGGQVSTDPTIPPQPGTSSGAATVINRGSAKQSAELARREEAQAEPPAPPPRPVAPSTTASPTPATTAPQPDEVIEEGTADSPGEAVSRPEDPGPDVPSGSSDLTVAPDQDGSAVDAQAPSAAIRTGPAPSRPTLASPTEVSTAPTTTSLQETAQRAPSSADPIPVTVARSSADELPAPTQASPTTAKPGPDRAGASALANQDGGAAEDTGGGASSDSAVPSASDRRATDSTNQGRLDFEMAEAPFDRDLLGVPAAEADRASSSSVVRRTLQDGDYPFGFRGAVFVGLLGGVTLVGAAWSSTWLLGWRRSR